MKTDLIKISLRQNAFYIPQEWKTSFSNKELTETTSILVANCAKLGFSFSEDLLPSNFNLRLHVCTQNPLEYPLRP